MNTEITIRHSTGEELHYTVTDRINSLINKGHEFNIKSIHPSQGYLLEITTRMSKEPITKDSQLIKNLKADMAKFLNMHPDDNTRTFEEYFKLAEESNTKDYHRYHHSFCEKFAPSMATIASLVPSPLHTSAVNTLNSMGFKYNGGKLWAIQPGSIVPVNNPVPNIIFGVLTTGEIFVEVNGQQHTPDVGDRGWFLDNLWECQPAAENDADIRPG